jgi:O-methyltransferase domain/Dimerisation domain
MSAPNPAPATLPPPVALLNLTIGHWTTQAIFVAAKLGIADLLREGARSTDELARSAGVDARSLFRLLRALASVGVFAQGGDGCFALTPMAECLQADAPGSMRAWALMMGSYAFQPWGELLHSVKTGETAFDHVHGMGFFDYLGRHAEEGRLFDESMTNFSGPEIAAIVSAYDFSGIGTLVDVAGGHGSLLSAILKANPAMKGVLADMPAVIEGARRHFEASHLADRCTAAPINFFESVPAGADAYLMKHIIHDWDDRRSNTILKNCHRAMAGKGKLLLAETVMVSGNHPEFGKWLDLAMLVYAGGCERTQEQYRDLLAAGGFRLTRIVPTESPLSVIEAVPV